MAWFKEGLGLKSREDLASFKSDARSPIIHLVPSCPVCL